MKRDHRLRSAVDFARVRDASPRVWAHPLMVLYVAPNDVARTRVGFTVSGRVGNAVVRNKVRRRLREAMRRRLPVLTTSTDLLVIARPRSAAASWADLNAALDGLLARAGATLGPADGL